jgi:hypothetical protein
VEFASFYIGSGLPPYLQACLSSWSDYGHSLDLYTYDEKAPIPRGVSWRDANEIVPSDQIFVYRKGAIGSVAAFSNLFRYELTRQRHVTWVDTDVLCLASNWPKRDYYLGWENEEHTLCNGAVFGAPQASEFVALLIQKCQSIDRSSTGHGELGPLLLTSTLETLGLEGVPAPSHEFYPLRKSEVRYFFDPARKSEVDDRVSKSYCVHFFDEMLARCRFPTFLRPPKGSYIEAILARHGVEIPVNAYFNDLEALDFDRRLHSVPLNDFVALENWAHELEKELIAVRESRPTA